MREKQNKKIKQNKELKEPKLYKESYMKERGDKQNRPPFLFLALVAFVVISFIWKGFVSNSPKENSSRRPVISDYQAADSVDVKR